MNQKRYPTVMIFMALLAVGLVASSCNTSKIPQKGERLLHKNTIDLDFPKKERHVRNLRYELTTLEKQKPNSNYLFFFPREGIYHAMSKKKPKKRGRFKNLIRRTIGEKPAIYKPKLAAETAQSMEYYLNNLGFFDARVTHDTQHVRQHKVEVVYRVQTDRAYTLDTVSFFSFDSKVQRILESHRDESLLEVGEHVSASAYNAEVARIVRLLRNRGYYQFDRSFVDVLRADSTGRRVSVRLEVFPPRDREQHPIFHIGQINVYPNYYPGDEEANLPDTTLNGIHYRSYNAELNIKPNTIERSVFLKTGDLYRLENLDKTKLQLNRLNNFRGISIAPRLDSLRADVLHIDIYLTPRKKLELGGDFEFNNSNYTVAQEGVALIGTSLGANYRNWNLFRNATLLDHRITAGIELNLREFDNPGNLIYSADASYTFGLFLPRYVPWTGPYKLLNKIRVGRQTITGEPKYLIDDFYRQLRETAKTRISANFSIRNISTLFLENSYNASFGYEFTPSPQHNFVINHTGFTLFFIPDSSITSIYREILNNNDFLRLSQDRQLFTGIFFSDFNYTFTSKVSPLGESWFFNGFFELSGLEAWGANQIYNGLSNRSDTFQILNDFRFEQFLKVDLDLRYYRKFTDQQTLVFRLNTGVTRPYGFSSQVPYVKQFFLGGGNSMRAWQIRELGPGSYLAPSPDSSATNLAFFQTADFKIEVNLEYRFNLIGSFDGAFFLDMGNIWSLDSDDERPNSQFNLIRGIDPGTGEATDGFLDQIAVGTGFGLRWDFSYFILRFDLGLKLREPSTKEWFPDWDPFSFNDLNANLAVGYPF
ncbi:MAG: BamA/TamA family outer membrane protein [Bacteroidota bacterium]